MVSLISGSPLQWPVVDGPCGPNGPNGISPAQWQAARDTAVAWLWAITGRRFGTITIAYRPEYTDPRQCARTGIGYARGVTTAAGLGGVLDRSFGGLALAPSIARTATVQLPGPVRSVESVVVDGIPVDPSAYLLQRDRLIRADDGTWPGVQDTTAPTNRTGTWQVNYTRGTPVPVAGQVAAGLLACEIGAAILGSDDCQLPANVQSVARNGVTVNLDTLQIQSAFTGLFPVDQWVRTVNPNRAQRPATVWTPDLDTDLLPAPVGLPVGALVTAGQIHDNGDGTYAITDPGLVTLGNGLFSLTSTALLDNGDGTFTYTGAAV